MRAGLLQVLPAFSTRTSMELVNAVAGILAGIFILLPGATIVPTSPIRGFLAVWPVNGNENWVGGLFLAFGVGTIVAWACQRMWCRVVGMAGAIGFWSTIFWQSTFSYNATSLIGALTGALFVGSMAGFVKLSREMRNGAP